MARSIVVIGGGPAAVFTAIEAKKRDASAEVTLLTDEACEPYEKPPLSKAVLLGKARPEDAPIAGPKRIAGMGINVQFDARCTTIDRAAQEVVTAAGRQRYDALVIATGSLMRELPMLPPGRDRVRYLRTDKDARALKADLGNCKHLVVVGAGLIGLEVAASAAELGIEVTVLEVAPRIMARVCDEETSQFIFEQHEHHGVEIELGAAIAQVTTQIDGHLALETINSDIYVADLIVVGTGVLPDVALARAAGLEVQDGIVVDAQCRTSDPNIFAVGDCTRFPGPEGPVRLENWRHAQEHGVIAGRNAAGGSDAYTATPSFWSEQYDLYIQGVGWPDAKAQRVHRPLTGKSTLTFEVRNGLIRYAVGINVQRDLAAVRRLIERKIPVDPAALADPAQPFANMLKAKT